jgi:hypothetical protein
MRVLASLAVIAALAWAPAAAGDPPKKKSTARCVRFDQTLDEEQTGAYLGLHNRCQIEVRCSIEWRISCDGEAGQLEMHAFDLARGKREVAHASAAACDGDWEVGDVRWACEATSNL